MLCLFIICHDDGFAPSERLVADIHAWHAEMERRGILRDGQPLRPPADAVTVRVRRGRPEITGGPFAATAEQMAAYELLECADLEEAVGLASRHPMATAGAIEVRPVWEDLALVATRRRARPATGKRPVATSRLEPDEPPGGATGRMAYHSP